MREYITLIFGRWVYILGEIIFFLMVGTMTESNQEDEDEDENKLNKKRNKNKYIKKEKKSDFKVIVRLTSMILI